MKEDMNKKIFYLIIAMLIIPVLFSGCVEKIQPIENNFGKSNNVYPYGIIDAPNQEYFGEEIEFDATSSFDPNGKIVSYFWDFGDNEIGEGKKVKHTYNFEKNFSIDYPLIYSVYLFVKNEKGSISATSHQIKLFPKEYILYLYSEQLLNEKPSVGKENIKCSGLLNIGATTSITYSLNKPISITKCNWNATIFLSKPIFLKVNKIKISLFDNLGNEILQKEKRLGFNNLWKEKKIDIQGVFEKDEDFKSIKITVYGFSISKKLFILYGGERASKICFYFKN